MSRLVEPVAPARLGVGFRWLLASSWISNLGDGVALAAGPLLAFAGSALFLVLIWGQLAHIANADDDIGDDH